MNLGWIWTENLRPLVELLGLLVGYEVDDLDWAAFEAGILGTDSEEGPWFDYSIGGSTVRVAFEPGASEMVSVTIDDVDDDAPLVDRLRWTAELLREYRVKRSR